MPAVATTVMQTNAQQAQDQRPAVVIQIASDHPMAALTTSTWALTSYRDAAGQLVEASAEPNRPAFIRLSDDGKINGSTGCNNFFASYTTAAAGSLTITPGGTTLMACFPESLAAQEQAVLQNLAATTTYTIERKQLQLQNDEGQVVLSFQQQQPVALENTLWVLTAYNNGKEAMVSPIGGTTITATFDEADRRLVGSTGCNTYFASYQVEAQRLDIGPVGSTRIACPTQIAEQEATFLKGLGRVKQFVVDGNQLRLMDADNQVWATLRAEQPD